LVRVRCPKTTSTVGALYEIYGGGDLDLADELFRQTSWTYIPAAREAGRVPRVSTRR
jgi:hypothetical protein